MRTGLEQISQEYSSTAESLTENFIAQFKHRQEVLTYDPMIAIIVTNLIILIFFITVVCLHPDKPQTMYGNRLQGYKRLMWIRWYFLCFCWIFFLWGACRLGKALAVDCSRRFWRCKSDRSSRLIISLNFISTISSFLIVVSHWFF